MEVGELLTKAFSTSNEEGVDSRRAEVSTSTFNPLYQFSGTLKGDVSDSRKRKKAKEERGSEGERGRGRKDDEEPSHGLWVKFSSNK